MTQYATTDDVRELASLVRTLLGDVTVLNTNVGTLSTSVMRTHHLGTLDDVTLTFLKENDILQFSSDGTWHNISPAMLGEWLSGEGGIVDTAIVKDLIMSEGAKLFLSKKLDDRAEGIITFKRGLISDKPAYLYDGVEIGNYIEGMLGGSGARIDKDGHAEMTSLVLREFLEVPELRFNRIDVVSGELWNSIAFGTVESVDMENQIVTLKLEEGEYSGLHVNDICRGIFHNLDGTNDVSSEVDENGFNRIQGFSTAYFTPVEILDNRGRQFRYSIKTGTTLHPCPSMKFAVYGNFLDSDRQASAYATKEYKRYLKDVNTWEITWQNIASQFGNLEGLNIPGAPDDGHLHGDGAYLTNVYMTGAMIEFTPEQEEILKGEDAYSVNLTRESLSVIVDNELNILSEYSQLPSLTFAVLAFKGNTELVYSDTYNENAYFLTWEATGVTCTMQNGVFTITDIISITNEPRIDLIINCEGNVAFHKTMPIQYNLQSNALWVTYNDNDAIPDRPTGDGTTNGWHRNYTASAIWMSTKSSVNVDEGVWGDPNRFRGASVAGRDGEYTIFVYTESSTTPIAPVSASDNGIPPEDPMGTLTWTLDPPLGDPDKGIWVWQSIATVYSDKTMSGWSTPFRLTGADGKDGTDGADIEFLYKISNSSNPPSKPAESNRDDYTEPTNGWYDNPQGVTEHNQYEWVVQRKKETAKAGTGTWGSWQGPTLWSKWGEKGMDGDGYEYIYYRTTEENLIPDRPVARTDEDEETPLAYINNIAQTTSSPGGMYWTDNPQGVRENLMFEWVSMRKKNDGVWSTFQAPALWSKWGETGLSGGNYQYRYKIAATPPTIPTDAAAAGWSTDGELIPSAGLYVWLIHRFANPDGTLTSWTGLIRLTGADGKDGEDGNSIEFLYARNNNMNSYPLKPNTTQETDWTGAGPDGTIWYDNPQGVDDAHRYEYVVQRYKNKATQQWGEYSNPGIWSVFADKGKDGDGYEYIYARFGNYEDAALCSKGEAYYPASPSYGPSYVNGDYQSDDHIPNKSCNGTIYTYTDNGLDVSESLQYQICWTRKKENGIWGDWKDGFIWTRWAKDGEKGDQGEQGNPGEDGSNGEDGKDATSYTISPGAVTVRYTKTGSYEPSSMVFRAYSKTGIGALSTTSGKWEVYGSDDHAPTSPLEGSEIDNGWSGSSLSFDLSQYTKYKYYTVAFNPTNYPIYDDGPVAASATITVVQDGADGTAANSQYTDIRFCGVWDASTTYYYDTATNLGLSSLYVNPNNAYVRDQVIHKGNIYLVKSTGSPLTNKTPSTSSSYWTLVSKQEAMALNTLLTDNGVLGDFKFSDTKFWSGDGGNTPGNATLFMDSANGEFRCTNATINGHITAISGSFNGTVNATSGQFENCAISSNCTIGNYVVSGSTLTSISGNDTMQITANAIQFTNTSNGISAAFGNDGSLFPAILGIPIPLHISVNRHTDINIGACFSATGAYRDDDEGFSGNAAIYILNGCVMGLRRKLRRIGSSTKLTTYDNIVICVNTSTMTLTLPSGCEDGLEFWMMSANSKTVNVTVSSDSNSNGGNTSSSISNGGNTFSTNRWHVYIWDAYNKIWHYSYMNHN